MATLNDANQANFDELDGHVKVLSAKITQMTSGNSGVQSAIEDLEDYYERQIQMRIMHNTTLREELLETKQKNLEIVRLLKQCAFGGFFGLFLIFFFVFPERVFSYFLEYWTYAVVALVTFFVSSLMAAPKPESKKT